MSVSIKRDRLLIVAGYLLVCVWVWPFVRYYVDNADTFQYISIAEHLVKGKWQYAINAYWSPLISWLLAPYLMVCRNGINAFKYLQIIIGVFVLLQWIQFLMLTTLDARRQRIIAYASIPFIVNFSLLNLTPDLLFVGIMLSFMNALIFWLEKKNDGSALGWYGGLLFLSKSFGITIFIFMMAVAWKMKGERVSTSIIKKIAKPFLLICGIWISLISIKEKKFTISAAARFNMTYEVAPIPEKIVAMPILTGGLLPPANPEALSAWEEPGSQISLTPLNPFSAPAHYLDVVRRNFLSLYYGDFQQQMGIVFLITMLFYFLFRRKDVSTPLWIKISLLVMSGMYVGYGLILMHSRYVWICSMLFLPASIYFLSEIKFISKIKIISEVFLISVTIFSLKKPVKEVLLNGDRSVNNLQLFHTIRSPKETMEIFYKPEKKLHQDIEQLIKLIPVGQNFASLRIENAERDQYADGLMIAYECKGKYFGVADIIDSTFKGYIISRGVSDTTAFFKSKDSGLVIYRY